MCLIKFPTFPQHVYRFSLTLEALHHPYCSYYQSINWELDASVIIYKSSTYLLAISNQHVSLTAPTRHSISHYSLNLHSAITTSTACIDVLLPSLIYTLLSHWLPPYSLHHTCFLSSFPSPGRTQQDKFTPVM